MRPASPYGFELALLNSLALALGRSYYLLLRTGFIFFFVTFIGATQFGLYTYAQSWVILLLPLVRWGGNELLIDRLHSTEGEERARLAGTSLILRYGLAAATALLIVAIVVATEDRSDILILVLIFSQGAVSRSVVTWYSSMFTAHGRSGDWVRFSTVFLTIEAILMLAAAYAGWTLIALALLQSALWWLKLYLVSVYFRWAFPGTRKTWDTQVAWSLLRRGASIGLGTFLLLSLTPGLLLSYRYLMPDLTGLGDVAIVLQGFLIMQQLLMLVSNALLPAINAPAADGRGNAQMFLYHALGISVCMGASFALALMLLIPEVLRIAPPTVFDSALLVFSAYTWIIIPVMALQGLRLVLISSDDVDGFLISAACGVAMGIVSMLLRSAQGELTAAGVLFATGMAFSTVVTVQILRLAQRGGVAGLIRPVFRFGLICALLAVVWLRTAYLPLPLMIILIFVFAAMGLGSVRNLRTL